MKGIHNLSQQLQWKLTFSYTITTVVAVLAIELLTFIAILAYFLLGQSNLWLNSIQVQANQANPYFVHGQADQQALTRWLQIVKLNMPRSIDSNQGFLLVVDQQGIVQATNGKSAPSVGTILATQLSHSAGQHLTQLLQGQQAIFSEQRQDNILMLAAAIHDMDQNAQSGKVLGAVVMQIPAINNWTTFISYNNLLPLILINIPIVTLLAGLAGTLFGYRTARGFTRRFQRLALVADQWSHGDFDVTVQEASADELGQLARRLNRMAERVQNLFQTQQQLATLEERNRLARDLHDSIKQQMFVVAMQVGAVRVLIDRDTEKAKSKLAETEQLIRHLQQELTSLIHEMRPVALENQDLGTAIKAYIEQWKDQTWITPHIEINYSAPIPSKVEQTLLRIVQEALSNVARHSNATQVTISLTSTEQRAELSLTDNGQGFQIEQMEGRGVGLLSMRERMQELGGSFSLTSSPGHGTQLHISWQPASAVSSVQKGKKL